MPWRIFTKHKEEEKKVEDKGAISCLRHGVCSSKTCPLWVELITTYKDKEGKSHSQQNGKCTFAWIPQLTAEMREAINARNAT